MSKIIEIKECGPFCPFFKPYGYIVNQSSPEGIACFSETSISGGGNNFWIKRFRSPSRSPFWSHSSGSHSETTAIMKNSFPIDCCFYRRIAILKI
jgi:hypothetical protein